MCVRCKRPLIHNKTAGKTHDGRMMKKYRARLCIPGLARQFFVILPSWTFQPSCCIRSLLKSCYNRELTQQDGWKTQDGRMTKKCRVRLGMHGLAPQFFVILLSWVFQPSCCVSSLICWSTRNFNSRPGPSPLPRANPGHLNFWRWDRSNSHPLAPKCPTLSLDLSVKCPS